MIESDMEGELIVRSRLKELVTKREVEEGRRIAQKEICEATGLNPNTVSRWMSPIPFDRFESKPVVALCDWLGVSIGDLLIIERRN